MPLQRNLESSVKRLSVENNNNNNNNYIKSINAKYFKKSTFRKMVETKKIN